MIGPKMPHGKMLWEPVPFQTGSGIGKKAIRNNDIIAMSPKTIEATG